MYRRELDNISDETLVKFFISEGVPKRIAKSLVKTSSDMKKTDKVIFHLDDVDEYEENEDYGFIIYDTVKYPPNRNPHKTLN